MRRILMGAIAGLAVLAIGVSGVSAAGHGWRSQAAGAGDGAIRTAHHRLWVDADGDGLCDHAGTADHRYWTDADGDGFCDYCGAEPGSGSCRYADGGTAVSGGRHHRGHGCR